MPNVNFGMPTDYGAEQADIERRRKYAEMLSQQSMEPLQSTTAGGYVVPINPLQGLAKMLQAYSGRRGQEMATEQGKDLAARRSQALAEALGGMPRARTEDLNPVAKDDEGNQMPGAYKTTYPSMPDYAQWQARLAPLGADAVAMGGNLIGMQQRAQEADEMRQFRAQQADETRQARMHEIQLRLQDARTTAAERAALQHQLQSERLEFQRSQTEAQRQFQDQMARQAAADRENLARITAGMSAANRAPVAVVDPQTGKPTYVSPQQAIGMRPYNQRSNGGLPASVMKQQTEMLEDVGLAGSINSDIGALVGQLNPTKGANGQEVTPALELGPLNNIMGQARNFVGMSNQESRNLASFKATLEKMRNDSLRLNKGVQTEGDAVRAWNELFSNINDQKVVSQRLQEIQRINQRAANMKQVQIDTLRQNFGAEPLDAGQMFNQPAAVGGNSSSDLSSAAAAELARRRKGGG